MNAARCTYNVCSRYISQRITRLVSAAAAAAAAAAESRGGPYIPASYAAANFSRCIPTYTQFSPLLAQ